MKKINYLSFILIVIISFTLLLNCSYSTEREFRIIGFRIQGKNLIKIEEEIKSNRETIYLTPEGQKDYFKLKRIRYFITNNNSRSELKILPIDHNFICYYLDRSNIWIAVKSQQPNYRNLVHVTDISTPTGFILFSEENKILLDIQTISNGNLLIDRESNSIFYKQDKNKISKLTLKYKSFSIANPSKIEITSCTDLWSKNITLQESLRFNSLKDIIYMNPSTFVYGNIPRERILSSHNDLIIISRSTPEDHAGKYYFTYKDKLIYTFDPFFNNYFTDITFPEMSIYKDNILYFPTGSYNNGMSTINIIEQETN